MRKADYAALAKIIKEKRDGQNWMQDFDPTGKHAHAFKEITNMAHAFARVANVNKAEFLQACGIEE